MINKRLINTGEAVVPFDPIQNFETVTYTGNGGTQKITGYIRKGGAFNGSSSYLNIPNVNSLFLSKTTSSVSFWFRLLNNSAKVQLFSDYAVESWNYAVSIEANGTLGIASRYNSGSIVNSTTSATYDDGNWHHLVVTHDVTALSQKAYIDGNTTPVLTNTLPSGTWSSSYQSTAKINIGHQYLPNTATRSEYLNGSIDQVRIFNKALSSSEVTTLYGETYASATKSTTDIFGDGSGVALYELDEDANDTGVPIDSGQSAVFNGSGSYIRSVATNDFNLQTFTVSSWVNFNAVNNYGSIASNYGTLQQPNGLGWVLRVNPSINKITFGDAYGTSDIASTTTPITGVWYHIAVTLDLSSNTIKIYVNGLLENTMNTYNGILYSAGGFPAGTRSLVLGIIGYNTNLSSSYLNGSIDQVRIYSSALSASDIEALASETNVPTANLLAHYKLDGNTNDETTNYNGTWSGTAAYSDPALRNYSGTPTNVNFLGMAFQPDLVWIKRRNAVDLHVLTDSIRGTDKQLFTNQTDVESGGNTRLTSFDSNGFTLSGLGTRVNDSGGTYVSWCWKAGGTAVSNTDGTITSTVSANVDAGFSIVGYTGNGTAGATVGHGLNSAPDMMIVKIRSGIGNWAIFHKDLGATKFLQFNTLAENTSSLWWNNTSPTSTVFSLGTISDTNANNSNYIAYCFHSVDGYQKIGSYTGTGVANTAIGDTGFLPRWVMIKRTDAGSSNWFILDSIRDTTSPYGAYLLPNASNAENNLDAYSLKFESTRFTVNSTDPQLNASGGTYIYLAIA